MPSNQEELLGHLSFLYGDAQADALLSRLNEIMRRYRPLIEPNEPAESGYFSEQDTVLITYGDMVQAPGERPLKTLNRFLTETVAESINTIHLLPFYPYSSDDGFSVIDYKMVDPALGEWRDVDRYRATFRLMFDAVINHVSAQSAWFKAFLADEPPYDDYFIEVATGANLKQVFRPRSLPLVSEVPTKNGTKLVWTTFSSDQVDLNFASPDVLLDVIDTVLFYVAHGAAYIRLDAVAYIWKDLGTTCIHLPQTHRIIQLLRSVLNEAAANVVLITETNVPHSDNVSYFGDGYNEAQMVYNFTLPPLALHSFHRGSAEALTEWAATLVLPSPRVTFFNFLASHDGIGLTPLRGILAEEEVQAIAGRVEANGGHVSYRSNPDGSESPYELNISFVDALGQPTDVEDDDLVARRFLAAQAIMLSLRGVPGIYFHSLFGSRSWHEGVQQSGRKRTINRQKLDYLELKNELADATSLRSRVFYPYIEMIRQRMHEPAFHPTGEQEILSLHPSIFALRRVSPDRSSELFCLQNVANKSVLVEMDLAEFGNTQQRIVDLLSGEAFSAENGVLSIELPPYGIAWLRSRAEKQINA